MAKYDPLRDYLRKQRLSVFELSFKEVEEIIGESLPRSAGSPQWWANTTESSGHVQRESWRAAGYDAFLIAGKSRVRFQKSH
jgi:hypothetical protein